MAMAKPPTPDSENEHTRRPDESSNSWRSREQQPGNDWGRLTSALVIVALVWFAVGRLGEDEPERIGYSEFRQRVQVGEVESVTFEGRELRGVFAAGKADEDRAEASGAAKEQGDSTEEGGEFVTRLPELDLPGLLPFLERHEVAIAAQADRSGLWMQVAIGLLPWLLLIGLIVYSSRQMQQRMGAGGGPLAFARSKAKRFERTGTDVGFDDIAGLENAKRDVTEIIEFLKEPGRFRTLGARVPKGILLMGPPGTGKTLLAKAVAGEADVPFYSISASEFIEMFVGVGASRVRDMFASAKENAPSIIFIDEIDSVGRVRGSGLGGGHDEREQTLNQILAEMDGFAPGEMVVVLAATNRPDVLDPALLRPGRFDRKITLDLPQRAARLQILEVHARDVPLADDVDLERLAARTVGFSGADLSNLVNEAALLAGRDHKPRVDSEAFDKARDKIVLGGERERMLEEEDRKLVALHESGHALLACLLPRTDPLTKVSIIPRGKALGATEQLPEEDRVNLRQGFLEDRLTVMLGGRAAEQLEMGEVSSGAEQDLEQATRLARRMVARWGMSKELGPVAFRRGEEHVFLGREMAQQRDFSEHTAQLIDDEVRALLRAMDERARDTLKKNRERLRALADALLDKEVLMADEIRAIAGV